jgi:hypothetical protein
LKREYSAMVRGAACCHGWHSRHLKNIALLKIYLNIYTKEVHQVYIKLMEVNEWFTNFHMAGSLVLVCQNDFSTIYSYAIGYCKVANL